MRAILYIAILIVLASCNDNYPKYIIYSDSIVPDSLVEKQRSFIIETVRAASQQMTGGDYEDPEDVIEQAEETANRLYAKEVQGLLLIPCHGCTGSFIPPNNFDANQKEIFKQLKIQK